MTQWRPLRVLIMGQQNAFSRVLAKNVQCWGHEATFLSPELEGEYAGELAGDVLLYDLDILSPVHKDTISVSPKTLALDHVNEYNRLRSLSRLIIVLSSHSVSRTMLEQIGAIAHLSKPFAMERLQRYLNVLHRLILAGTQGEVSPRTYSGNIRVLVVDDDHIVTRVIQQHLTYEPGYAVAVAHDGLTALEQCLDWQPDCVVTDLIMPWMNGYQVMRCLSDISLHAMPAFVVMSALTHLEGPGNQAYLQGKIVKYVDKPFRFDHLLTTIKQVCTDNQCQTA